MALRLWIVLAATLFGACQTRTNVELTFPPHIDEWQLTRSQVVRDSPMDTEASRVHRATYEKDGRIIVVYAYELPSETVAFEAMQKFRQGEKLAFHKGSRFFTVESPEVDRAVLSTFASNLQQAIK